MKSVIFKNDIYLDSTGIVHGRKKLSETINGTVLFENSNGTSSTSISFSENINEGDYIEIVFGRARVSTGEIVLKTTGKIKYSSGINIVLDMMYLSGTDIQYNTEVATISSTGLTLSNASVSNIVITKVIKY